MKVFDYLLERLKEPSTKQGIILGLGLLGVKLTPEFTDAILNLTLSVYVCYQILRKEQTI
jgi:hypothetical protein